MVSRFAPKSIYPDVDTFHRAFEIPRQAAVERVGGEENLLDSPRDLPLR